MKKISFLFLICALLPYLQCTEANKEMPSQKIKSPNALSEDTTDHHSFAKPKEAQTKHLSLSLKVDFDQRILSGKASFTIDNQQATRLILDSRDLQIEKVSLGEAETPTSFTLSKAEVFLGQALTIKIEKNTKLVHVYYQTKADGAAALDWLQPQQTAGKKHPFLFTQGQAILTRTWIPCQDSPGIRITYDAQIEVPKDLLAVMSASNPQRKNEEGIYKFEMKQAIPPYLIALSVGDLVFGEVGARTGIYAEPSMLEKAVYEFGDMEKMLVKAESLYGKYLWERYDVIVLPPSFPFGGMENPRLTFATPTIIAGDRSLTSLIAHELAHSWSGNLVTNATWNDFWLNEGFTVYFERRIMEELYGKDYANMLALLGYQDLENDVAELDKKDTHLKLDLKGRDPDDGMTDIAYEKGAFFLLLLEQQVGREKFDAFLKSYFNTYQFKTISTTTFIKYLKENLLEPNQVTIDIDEWIFGPGIPANCPKIESDKFALVDQQVKLASGGAPAKTLNTTDWSTHEWLHFIRHLPKNMAKEKMKNLDQHYKFSRSGNSEILAAWFETSIKNGYGKTLLPEIEAFLVKVGRRKFLTPLYGALKESNQLEVARKIYAKAKPNYHAVSTQTLDELLEIE